MPNHLADQTSPYLLQHKNNPVDWHPWGEAAIAKARAEQKPIFLSIGYSACHWCHVMEHESFEDQEIAAILNKHFVSIKVDREERPDLDQIYMQALQVYFQMVGSPQGGGWPLSMFLTPELRPFLGGTYWPPRSAYGRPGFADVLQQVAKFWQEHREQVVEQAGRITEYLQHREAPPGGEPLSLDLLRGARRALERNFDARHGGFGGAPKFPHPLDLRLLLRIWQREKDQELLKMVTLSLEKMAAGGIYDHLGGGFARYAVDERWLVPHFEKMLYDNAMLSQCYIEAYQATGNADFARVARETYEYVLRDMTHPDGGFYSAQDADSEGEEGKYYVWKPAEIEAVLGPQAAKSFCYVYDVTEPGNFEGHSILNLPKTLAQCAAILKRNEAELAAELAQGRRKLLEARRRRVPPGLDDKVLVSWNALMIDSLATAAGVLDEPRYLAAATAAAEFILTRMRRPDGDKAGRLLHAWREGQAKFDAYLDDYACLINALVTLYETGFVEKYIDEAIRLAEIVLGRFPDAKEGGYFYTADDHEQLIARQKDIQDNPVPSGNGMIAQALLRLGKLTGHRSRLAARDDLLSQSERTTSTEDFLPAGESTLAAFSSHMARIPSATAQMLLALDLDLGPTHEVVLMGGTVAVETLDVLAHLRQRYAPRKVLASRNADQATEPGPRSAALNPLFEGKVAIDGRPTLYVCENFACREPVAGKDAVINTWNATVAS
jgi:uncharacterized protein YyaL (SSP411 family)